MITYVNTVLVGTGVGTVASTFKGATKGQYIVVDNNGNVISSEDDAKAAEAIKVGLVNKADATNGIPSVKWSNIIKKADIKSYSFQTYPTSGETEDAVTIDFTKSVNAAADQEIRVVVRLTFKDTPTRYRKWTESYEVVVAAGSDAKTIVDAFVKSINVKNVKRARVNAVNNSNKLVLTALPYDDDDTVDSISPANKVRFSANSWYTIPSAKGFDSKNKYAAAEITKVCGTSYTASAKLVRDAEAQGMGYQGILNRGEGTWPIIKPAMNVDLDAHYDSLTLEFENMYRTADDLQRRTKQALNVYDITGYMNTASTGLKVILEAFVQGEHADTYKEFGTSESKDTNK